MDVQPDRATVLGQPTFRRDQQMQNELMAINQELAVLSRQRTRELRDERYEREAAEKLNRERNAFLRILAHELRQPIGSALAGAATAAVAMTVARAVPFVMVLVLISSSWIRRRSTGREPEPG